jgi:hypothetical protein
MLSLTLLSFLLFFNVHLLMLFSSFSLDPDFHTEPPKRLCPQYISFLLLLLGRQ